MGGSSSGTPTSEFRLQSKHNENSSFSTFKILNIFSSDWITFNENYISNNKFQYRIEMRMGTPSVKYDIPVYIGIDNITITEIKL